MQSRFVIRYLLFKITLPAIEFLNNFNLILLSLEGVRSEHGVLVETLDNLVIVRNLAIAIIVLEQLQDVAPVVVSLFLNLQEIKHELRFAVQANAVSHFYILTLINLL